jgi:hypothetical protein
MSVRAIVHISSEAPVFGSAKFGQEFSVSLLRGFDGPPINYETKRNVLEIVMLGSSVSLASWLRIGSGEVCWIWQSAGAPC